MQKMKFKKIAPDVTLDIFSFRKKEGRQNEEMTNGQMNMEIV